jgi:hypothetical protein
MVKKPKLSLKPTFQGILVSSACFDYAANISMTNLLFQLW